LLGGLLLSAAVTLPAPPAAAFGVGLQPTTVEMIVEPGESYRQVITVSNIDREKTVALTVGLADWDLDARSELVLLPPGSYEASPSTWVRFSPATVKLTPLTSQQIVVDIHVPASVARSGDHRLAIIASTLLPPKSQRATVSGVWRRFQVATLFYLTVAPGRSEPRVVEARLARAGGAPALELGFDNPGDAHARIKGHLSLLDGQGKTVHRQEVNAVVLDRRRLTKPIPIEAPWQDLPPGHLKVALELRDSFNPDGEPGAPVPVDPPLPVIQHR
jgi:hypothetical protein